MATAHRQRRCLAACFLAVLLGVTMVSAIAQTKPSGSIADAGGFFALPVELDMDYGAANGDANILRIQPVYTFPVAEKWKLIHLDIITLADAPAGTPAFPGEPGGPGSKSGVSDLLHASFFMPNQSGNFVWGVGLNLAVPTATSDGLGSGKWAVGPAFRLAYRTGQWNLGAVVGQRWSFAGSDNRNHVNQLLIRGAIRRQLGNDWHFVSAPIITANWDLSGERWVVPLGGGIGRRFRIGDYPWAWSVQGYANVIKPDSAPDWLIRFGLVAAIPFRNR